MLSIQILKKLLFSKLDPAQSIYDAFQREAEKRQGRSVQEWTAAELMAVFHTANVFAKKHGLLMVSMADVEKAERYAFGSVDYGAMWAYKVADKMKGISK